MPLYTNAIYLVRANLVQIHEGGRASLIVIGELTQTQFADIHVEQTKYSQPLLQSPEIVFLGRHFYNSRMVKNAYTIDDLLLQVESALDVTSQVIPTNRMTGMKSTVLRNDGYGNQVYDQAIFEMTSRKPRAELYSVIPKGDHISPSPAAAAAYQASMAPSTVNVTLAPSIAATALSMLNGLDEDKLNV